MGTLCQYCKVLEIDDAAWGGFRDESIPGKNVLAFSGGNTYKLSPDDKESIEFLRKYPDSRAPVRRRFFKCHYGRRFTFPELSDLNESAAECGFCALLRTQIRWRADGRLHSFNDRERTIDIWSFSYTWYEAIGENNIPFRIFDCLNVYGKWMDGGTRRHFSGPDIKIYTPDGPCATWLSIPEEPEEPPKTQDLWEKISTIKSSLWKCSEECGHRKFSDSVPSRLIYVGEKTEFGFGDPRLVVLSDPEYLPEGCTKESIEYAILSYCWGESASSTLTTTMSNLATHLKKIPLAKMPATCRDAILVTRALGLKWLWVDAICIIQGNAADWHNEAAEMASVYGNAFVTIIPLRSLSSHDGFLHQLQKPPVIRVPFKSSIDPSIEGHFNIRASLGEKDIDHTLLKELFSSKWQTRGWTYQEDTMSQRKLYFGETDIYFRCCSQRTITSGSTATKSSEIWGEHWPLAERREATTIAETTKHSWYQSLDKFCLRELTFKTDVLPAISAVAKMHCNDVQEDYQCGLWRSDLHNGVLWKTKYRKLGPEEHMKKLTSQNNYVAPSWSWASGYAMGYTPTYGLMYLPFNKTDDSPLWTILETDVRLADPSNPFGPVLSGHILAQGRWCSLSSLRIDYSTGYVFKGNKKYGTCSFDWAGDMKYKYRQEALPASYKERLVILLVSEYPTFQDFDGILLIPSVGNETWYRVGTYGVTFWKMERSDGRASKEEVDELFRISDERVFKIV